MTLKSAIVDASFFIASNFLLLFNPLVYSLMWICAIVISKTLFTVEERRAHTYLKALVVSAPIGGLASMASFEGGLGFAWATVIGTLIALSADRIFLGGWFDKAVDTALDIIKSRLSK